MLRRNNHVISHFGKVLPIRNIPIRAAVLLLLRFAGTVGGACALRTDSVSHLPLNYYF